MSKEKEWATFGAPKAMVDLWKECLEPALAAEAGGHMIETPRGESDISHILSLDPETSFYFDSEAEFKRQTGRP